MKPAVFVLLVSVHGIASFLVPTKPGKCPAASCKSKCTIDQTCKGTKKCCKAGCRLVCRRSNKGELCKYGDAGPCGGIAGFRCSDSLRTNCTMPKNGPVADAMGKCCYNFRQDIVMTFGMKPGVCPKRGTKCEDKCNLDTDCKGLSKCCHNGCRKVCKKPIEDKPARQCPSTEGKIGICVEQCSQDSDCDKDEMCCSNGCGHVCTQIYEFECEHLGKTYGPGPFFDGCNNCICSVGNLVACTRKFCPGQCIDSNRVTRANGESWMVSCNTCTCDDQVIHCTRNDCGGYKASNKG